jgi:hypothetical protein
MSLHFHNEDFKLQKIGSTPILVVHYLHISTQYLCCAKSLFSGPQIHDSSLHDLKLQVHQLVVIKCPSGTEA